MASIWSRVAAGVAKKALHHFGHQPPLDARFAEFVVRIASHASSAFADWGDIFGDAVIAGAMLDRYLHHCHVLNLKGKSYRIDGRLSKENSLAFFTWRSAHCRRFRCVQRQRRSSPVK
jgi:hypothetical protein